ncbi:MAG: hypothetical protein Q4G52_09585 [Clostridia bacterium]|nr:hypothetical protein [Clostridia bacterium]
MELSRYVACICEGTAEEVIVSKLLDADRLIFTRDDLLDGEIIRTRSAAAFEQRYLRKGFQDKITVMRVLDSRRENFKISKAYEHKIEVINVITAPEIEMLIILNERKYDIYRRSRKKPSDFCKEYLKMSSVKSRKFVEDYFSNTNRLIEAIREYRRISKVPA